MVLQDSHSEIAKLVWSYLRYTPCKIDGQDSTVIEINEVWELISEIEAKYMKNKEALDFNVQQNLGLIKENHRLHLEIKRLLSEKSDGKD